MRTAARNAAMPYVAAVGALAAAVVCLGVVGPAAAQQVPRTEDTGTIERRFRTEPTPQAGPGGPAITIPGNEAPLPAGADALRFTLARVTVEGASVYPKGTLEALAATEIGKSISLADATEIAQRITARYRGDGYILSRAILPPQEITDTLKIRVVEGFIDTIKVEGGVTDRLGIIGGGAAARRVLASRPLQFGDLERLVLLANDLAGVAVRSVLRPTAGAPAGASTLVLVASDERFRAGAGVDNFGTTVIGPVQANVEASVANLAGMFEEASVRFILADPTAEPPELRYGRAQVEMPLGGDGLKLFASGSFSDAEPGKSLDDPLGLRSKSRTVDLRLSYPVIRSRRENLYVDGGFRHFDSRSTVFKGIAELSEDRLRTLSASVSWDVADPWGGVSILQGSIEQALRILKPTERGMSRADAENDYTLFRSYAARYQNLAPLIGDTRFTLLGAIEGQYSPDLLPAVAEFSVGGSRFGRGYFPSEISGESGLAGKLELQFADGLPYLSRSRYQLFAFIDAGATYDDSHRSKNETLSSYGGGVRLDLEGALSLELYGAKPWSRDLDYHPDSKDNGRAPRFHFSVSTRY